MNISLVKQNIRYIWLFLIICLLGYYFYNPIFFRKENIAGLVNQYQDYGLLILFLLHLFRGFTMLPPTILIFAGIIMYPDRLSELLIISIVGAVLSGALAYHFSKKMDFKVWLKQHQGVYKKIQNGLNSKYGILFIVGWVLFPFVPTDIISYTAGATRTPFIKYLVAYTIAKIILSSIYIYGGEFMLDSLSSLVVPIQD